MTFEEVKKLAAGESVGYKRTPNGQPIDCLVIQNGPRLDADGKQIPYMPDVLVIQLGTSGTRVSWEPELFPQGIPELEVSTNPAPAEFQSPPPPTMPTPGPIGPQTALTPTPTAAEEYPHPEVPHVPTPAELGQYVPTPEELITERERTLTVLPSPDQAAPPA